MNLADLRALVEVLGYNPCKHCGKAPDDWVFHCGHAGDEHRHVQQVTPGTTLETHNYRPYVVADLLGKELVK